MATCCEAGRVFVSVHTCGLLHRQLTYEHVSLYVWRAHIFIHGSHTLVSLTTDVVYMILGGRFCNWKLWTGM